jgi:hypothetical protein
MTRAAQAIPTTPKLQNDIRQPDLSPIQAASHPPITTPVWLAVWWMAMARARVPQWYWPINELAAG